MTPLVPLLARRLLPAADAALAVTLVAVCGYAAHEQPVSGGAPEPVWLPVLTGLLVAGPVLVRRRWPVAVAVTVCGTATAALAAGVVPDFAAGGPAAALGCALYTVGAATPRRRSVSTAAGCLALLAATLLVVNRSGGAADFGFLFMLLSGAWFIGWLVRERRAHAAQAAQQLAQRAVADERLRIAREMHDIVAHSMSLIAVKAAVGNHVAEASPAQARDALRVIEETSRGALVEMRRALGVLRDGAAYAPAPSLGDLPALADQAAAGGVSVSLAVPEDAALPEAVALSVFRIVQEALTNVVKHAAPARCWVAVTVHAGEVRVEVTDDGRSPGPPAAPGHGLIGIRERVTMYGGEFAAGPRPEGGFRVATTLPYGTAT